MIPIILFVALVSGSFAGIIMVEMLYNDGWLFAFRVLGIIELVIVPWLLYRFRESLLSLWYFQPRVTLIMLVSACTAGLLIGPPYVFLANAVTSSGEVVLFAGTVKRKWRSPGKAKGYIVTLIDQRTGRSVDVQARRHEYDSVAVGAQFSRCMFVGRFNIPFLWRYGSPPSCSA